MGRAQRGRRAPIVAPIEVNCVPPVVSQSNVYISLTNPTVRKRKMSFRHLCVFFSTWHLCRNSLYSDFGGPAQFNLEPQLLSSEGCRGEYIVWTARLQSLGSWGSQEQIFSHKLLACSCTENIRTSLHRRTCSPSQHQTFDLALGLCRVEQE